MFSNPSGDDLPVRIKICGITNPADAEVAIDAGADALGFNFFPGSKRYIDLKQHAEWIAKLPADVCKVAVLVNPTLNEAIHIANIGFINALQLHGSESPDFCRLLAERGIHFAKAIPVKDEQLFVDVPDFFTDTVLLDSSTEHGFGGSGQTLPWNVGRRFVEDHPGLNVVLAGGLTPENVAAAIKQVKPFGVDVTSGVEYRAGRKDSNRLRAFIAAARSS
jgi:phosphoribosylanthranilate isomerase